MAWGSINVPDSGATTQSSTGTPPTTGATVGDTWYNSEDEIFYICTSVDDEGNATWIPVGAGNASDLKFGNPEQTLGDVIAALDKKIITALSAELQAGSVVLTLPVTVAQGSIICFKAPCDSEDMTVGLVIENVQYPLRNQIGESLAGVSGLFIEDAMVAVIIDRGGVVAYLLSASSAKGFVTYSGSPPEHRMNGVLYGQILADFEG